MTKRQDALNKAKKSGKEIVKGGKKFGIGTIQLLGGTSGAIGYALLSLGEKGVETFSGVKGKKGGMTNEERKEHEDRAKKYSERSKKHIKEAGNLGKTAAKGTGNFFKGSLGVVGHTIEGSYHLVDALDKAIGEKIEKSQVEQGKNLGKIGRFFSDKILKFVIALSLALYGGYKVPELIKELGTGKYEKHYSVSFEERDYFKNEDFFNKNFKIAIDTTYQDKGVILIRDVGMSFYVVQDGENTKKQIREKLSSIPEFSYLIDSIYDDKITGFNVPDISLTEGLYIPIPVKAADRKIEVEQFREYSRIALHEMEQNPVYGEKAKKLIKECGEEKILNTMIAFARCETATDQQYFSDPIGTTVLHRWEPKYHSFSFSYYHILMEKNADGKTPGPGLKARQRLGLTEGQCYHPINAGKLFLGYCFEKKKDPTYFFKIRNLEEAKIKGGKYNGDSTYGGKLWENIQHLSKKAESKI